MRSLTLQEIEVLKQNERDAIFTDEELNALFEGKASFKVFNMAEKMLQKHKSHMMGAVSRQEALQNFLHLKTFQHFHITQFTPKMNRLQAVIDLLEAKGVLTLEEIEKALQEGVEKAQKELEELQKAKAEQEQERDS